MYKKFRFIDEPYLKPCENMAIDEALIENFQPTDAPIFRLYTWDKDAFSIGRFQDPSEIKGFTNYGDNFTRRQTGGGLLLHGFDIAYSLIIPTNLLMNKSVKQSYEYLCSFLLDFYNSLSLKADFAKDILSDKLSKSAFCQVGFEPYDIIVQGKKIGGNAQKRTKNFIYQHGSIPLHVDTRLHSGVSLDELGVSMDTKKGKELLKNSFQKSFDTLLIDSRLTNQESEDLNFLHVNKYSTKEWKYDKRY